MQGDGLYEPLGQPGGSSASAPWAKAVRRGSLAVLALLVVAGTGALLWKKRHPAPEEVAAVAPVTVPPPPKKPAAPAAQPAAPAPAGQATAGGSAEEASGVTVVRPPGFQPPPGTFIPVPKPADSVALTPAPDPRLAETTRIGILPRRGSDGSRPAEVYARPAPAAAAGKPRIALFVGGMGLNAGLTNAAARDLPPAVTLGFAPYGGDLGDQVARARALGHEAVLQVPMESFNAPDGSSMPRMLSVGDRPQETLDNLHWQMSRFTGYAGVSSFLGARFTADTGAFTPVLRDLAARGLFYLDDGTAPRNLAPSLGPALGLPVIKADVVIDALADPDAIEAALRKLETVARSKGVALGATTGLPNAVDHLAAFANGLQARGIVLVPASSLADAAPALPPRP